MRKRSGSLVITFMVAAIIFVFIFWGIGTMDGTRRQGAVAFVNGDRISAEDYLEELTKTVNIYRNFLGEKFDRKLLEQFNIKRQTLDALITRKLVLHETERLQVRISDLELKDAIKSTEVFQVNGRFSPQRYRDLLTANRLTPQQYEGDQRRELIFQKIGSFIRRNTLISPLEAKTNYMIDNDRMNLSFIKIDPNQFSKDVQVSPDEIAKFL
ncbi:MAG: SurA N-terminal domain-containing protein, partial [Deltaproteobacteria bacterium]|nr:SurA N-terminal domain-containing protein [Deltaproteobacteria bacterium]